MTTSGENDKFVTLIASLEGGEPIRRRVRKDVIQSESSFLKEYIKDGATEIKIPLRRPKNLDSILKYIYEEKLTVSKETNLESLWNDARILGLVNLEKLCIQQLTDTISLDSWIQRLQFSQVEACHELESNVLSFVNANFKDCSYSSSFTLLNVDQMFQVLQLPTVQTTVTEPNRIALILNWIKASENDRCPQAHRLLDKVDLTKMTENSLRSFFDEESAFRNWRCVAIFERAIRLKNLAEITRNSETVRAGLDQFELFEGHPGLPAETAEGTRIIKQEVPSEESSDAEDHEVNESYDDVSTNSAQESTFSMKQELNPPSSASVFEAVETNDHIDYDPSAAKIPRLEDSVADPTVTYQPRASSQKQILYLRQTGQHGYNLNCVVLHGDSVSQAKRVQVDLPDYNNHVPKIIWSEEARGLFLLGGVNKTGRVLSTVRYMNGQRPLKVTDGPKMLCRRHRFPAVIFEGSLCVIGGSRKLGLESGILRRSKAEVMHMTADSSGYKWLPMDSTPIKCDLFTAAVADGRIYMIGGLRDTGKKRQKSLAAVTNEVICYEPTTNKWNFVSSMALPRCGHTSAVVGRRIYVLGGCNLNYTNPQADNLRTAEVYDIDKNDWAFIAPMRRPRFGGSALEMDGKIYIFGGDYNGEGKIPASVECYDPVSDSWTYVCTSVDNQGSFDSIAVIDNPDNFL